MIRIGRKEIIWNYAATFLKIASSALLLPAILRMMPSEMVGIWTVFITITAFAGLLDFGFNPSFTRNVTYVFSGVTKLKTVSFESVSSENQGANYDLLKGVIAAMRWFYSRTAIILFLLLATIGTYYIYKLLQDYKGDHQQVYIAWVLLCIVSTYNLYTQYYDALLQGKGLVKESKQIVIIGQTVYLVFASVLILAGYGLIAIISAQASSVIIIRWLSYRTFFTSDVKDKLSNAVSHSRKEVLKAIYPNALKIGLTILGGFMLQRSALVMGSLYLSLEEIASYGITMQIISVIAGLSMIYTSTYQPETVQLRVTQNNNTIKNIYLKGQIVLLLTYVAGGMLLLLLGEWTLDLLGSKTPLIPSVLILIAILISLLENNHTVAGGILLTKNEVPFFKASIISGLSTILLMYLFLGWTKLGIVSLFLAPGLVDIAYQSWKWPLEVIKELDITYRDIKLSLFKY